MPWNLFFWRTRAHWLHAFIVPLLFQAFLVVGALDPLLDAGIAVHSTSPLCSVATQQGVSSREPEAPLSPSPHDVGFDHAHCPLCASLALGLPLDQTALVPLLVAAKPQRNKALLPTSLHPSPPFLLPPAQAPPHFS